MLGPLLDPLGAGSAVPPAADPAHRRLRLAELLREKWARTRPRLWPAAPGIRDRADDGPAGILLDELIHDGMSIAIGWGRTLSASIKRLRPRQLKDMTRASETNAFDVSTELARTLGSDCYFVTAPVYCPSIESREILLTHSGVNEVIERARNADLAIVSCGDLTLGTKMTTPSSIGKICNCNKQLFCKNFLNKFCKNYFC